MAAICSGKVPINRYQPEISEWGNPTTISSDLRMQERTQGSKTFQYLEEEKANQGTFFLIYTI